MEIDIIGIEENGHQAQLRQILEPKGYSVEPLLLPSLLPSLPPSRSLALPLSRSLTLLLSPCRVRALTNSQSSFE